MSNDILTVAVAQMEVTGDIAANAATVERAIDFAVAEGADILLTPEGSVSGYTPDFDAAAARGAVDALAARAAAAGLGLALGTCLIEPDDGLCYNELRFYDKSGAFLGFHAKALRCGSLADPPVGEIDDYAARSLRTFDFHGLIIGGLICNDLWANPVCTPMDDPHLLRRLAERGARVVFHAVNGGREGSDHDREVTRPFHESNLRLRAQAARVFVVTADNSFPSEHPVSSPGGVVGPDGAWLARAPDRGERFLAATIDLCGGAGA